MAHVQLRLGAQLGAGTFVEGRALDEDLRATGNRGQPLVDGGFGQRRPMLNFTPAALLG
jgi:hypothetical protein